MQKELAPQSVNTDIPARELPDTEFSRVSNMTFAAKAALRVDGYADIANPALLHEPYYLMYNRVNRLENYYIYPGATDISVTDQQNHFNISPTPSLNPSLPGEFVGTTINNIAMLTNGKDAPHYWNGDTANAMQPLPDWPENTLCGWIRAYKYNAIAGNITVNGVNYENQLYWSASVNPGLPPQSWTPLPSNDAGDNILAATQGTLIDGHLLRNQFVLAKNHSLYLMTYVGGNFVFKFDKLSVTIGVLANNCMVEYKGTLFIFSDGDIVATNGQMPESIANERVRTTIFSQLNYTYYNRCFVFLHKARDEIYFCYPTGANEYCNQAAVFDLTNGAWGFRDIPAAAHIASVVASNEALPISWQDDEQAWQDDATIWDESGATDIEDGGMIASLDDTGHLYGIDYADTINGQPVTALIAKDSMDMDNLSRVKLLKRVWIYALGTAGDRLQVRIGVQMHDNDPISWNGQQDFILGESDYIDVTLTGRLFSIEITHTGNDKWRVYRLLLDYDEKGKY